MWHKWICRVEGQDGKHHISRFKSCKPHIRLSKKKNTKNSHAKSVMRKGQSKQVIYDFPLSVQKKEVLILLSSQLRISPKGSTLISRTIT
jgi:hypothetical protein